MSKWTLRPLLTPSVMDWKALQAELHRHNMFNADHQEALDANAAMDTIDALIVEGLGRDNVAFEVGKVELEGDEMYYDQKLKQQERDHEE